MANTIFFIALGVTLVSFGLMSGIYIHLKRSERAWRHELKSEGRE